MCTYLVAYESKLPAKDAEQALQEAFGADVVPVRPGLAAILYGGHAGALEANITHVLGPLPFLLLVRVHDDWLLRLPPRYGETQTRLESMFPDHRYIS